MWWSSNKLKFLLDFNGIVLRNEKKKNRQTIFFFKVECKEISVKGNLAYYFNNLGKKKL